MDEDGIWMGHATQLQEQSHTFTLSHAKPLKLIIRRQPTQNHTLLHTPHLLIFYL